MKRSKNFTLVELLVVIAIIVILMSMLLPTLNKAREIAKKAKCINNEKTLGLTIAMYGADNSGWVLPYGSDLIPGGNWENWAFILATYLYPGKSYSQINAMWSSKSAYFLCPGDKTSAYVPPTGLLDVQGNTRSYVSNALVMAATAAGVPKVRESMVRKPSDTLTLGELNGISLSVGTGVSLWSASTSAAISSPFASQNGSGKWTRQTHGTMQNFLFFDGHAKTLTIQEGDNKNLLP